MFTTLRFLYCLFCLHLWKSAIAYRPFVPRGEGRTVELTRHSSAADTVPFDDEENRAKIQVVFRTNDTSVGNGEPQIKLPHGEEFRHFKDKYVSGFVSRYPDVIWKEVFEDDLGRVQIFDTSKSPLKIHAKPGTFKEERIYVERKPTDVAERVYGFFKSGKEFAEQIEHKYKIFPAEKLFVQGENGIRLFNTTETISSRLVTDPSIYSYSDGKVIESGPLSDELVQKIQYIEEIPSLKVVKIHKGNGREELAVVPEDYLFSLETFRKDKPLFLLEQEESPAYKPEVIVEDKYKVKYGTKPILINDRFRQQSYITPKQEKFQQLLKSVAHAEDKTVKVPVYKHIAPPEFKEYEEHLAVITGPAGLRKEIFPSKFLTYEDDVDLNDTISRKQFDLTSKVLGYEARLPGRESKYRQYEYYDARMKPAFNLSRKQIVSPKIFQTFKSSYFRPSGRKVSVVDQIARKYKDSIPFQKYGPAALVPRKDIQEKRKLIISKEKSLIHDRPYVIRRILGKQIIRNLPGPKSLLRISNIIRKTDPLNIFEPSEIEEDAKSEVIRKYQTVKIPTSLSPQQVVLCRHEKFKDWDTLDFQGNLIDLSERTSKNLQNDSYFDSYECFINTSDKREDIKYPTNGTFESHYSLTSKPRQFYYAYDSALPKNLTDSQSYDSRTQRILTGKHPVAGIRNKTLTLQEYEISGSGVRKPEDESITFEQKYFYDKTGAKASAVSKDDMPDTYLRRIEEEKSKFEIADLRDYPDYQLEERDRHFDFREPSIEDAFRKLQVLKGNKTFTTDGGTLKSPAVTGRKFLRFDIPKRAENGSKMKLALEKDDKIFLTYPEIEFSHVSSYPTEHAKSIKFEGKKHFRIPDTPKTKIALLGYASKYPKVILDPDQFAAAFAERPEYNVTSLLAGHVDKSVIRFSSVC